MKPFNILSIGIAALAAVSTASAAGTVIHVTGSTAFRGATTAAIKNVLGGAATVKTSYAGTSGGASGATYAVFQSTAAAVPGFAAGDLPVTVKCTWTGSVGGVKTIASAPPIAITATTAPNGWMSVTNLTGGAGVEVAVVAPSYTLDTTVFTAPVENLFADVAMSDSHQSSTGFTTVALTETNVGVIPFEWVANNGSPANLNGITPLLAQALLSGGMPLSQFTKSAADQGTVVYAMGRDFDSGTRLACLAETGIAFRGSVQHIEPRFNAAGAGTALGAVLGVRLWHGPVTVLGETFQIGQSGFSGGGALADALATPGSSTADPSESAAGAGDAAPFGAGWLVAMLGRSDASRACKTTVIAGNTAHRMTWNGVADWVGPILASGAPTSFDDEAIRQGDYSLWEFEFLTYRGDIDIKRKIGADKIAADLLAGTASTSGIVLSTMSVNRPVEGGLITFGAP